jgi:hypothetical protein
VPPVTVAPFRAQSAWTTALTIASRTFAAPMFLGSAAPASQGATDHGVRIRSRTPITWSECRDRVGPTHALNGGSKWYTGRISGRPNSKPRSRIACGNTGAKGS